MFAVQVFAVFSSLQLDIMMESPNPIIPMFERMMNWSS